MASEKNCEHGTTRDSNEATQDGAHFVAGRGHAATDKYGKPLVHFDAEAEAKLRWKIDLMIVPTVALLYCVCFIDRANIGNAKIAGFEKDLGLKGKDYNVVLSVFYVSYTLFEIPSNLLCKRVGPGWFLPLMTLLFGITSLGTAFVQNRGQACAVRFLMGMLEAGSLPGIAYYMSRWYRHRELAFRLSLYMIFAPLAGAFGGLLASVILKLDEFVGLRSWRMIFGIEGIITICVAAIGFFTMTDRPETARWLTAEERDLAIARVKSERVGATELLERIDGTKVLRGILNPVTLSTAVVFLFNNITVQGLAFFAPTIVRTIYPDKSTVEQQLFTVPPYVVGSVFVVLVPTLSWMADRRHVFLICSAPSVMVGYMMFLASHSAGVRYAATFLIACGAFILGPMSNAQVSANLVSDTARSAGIGMNVMMGNIGGLIATWSFLPFDAPDYRIGNGLNLAASSAILIITTATLFWMHRDNKLRDSRSDRLDQELEGLTPQQVEDLDWKHPAFRWKP